VTRSASQQRHGTRWRSFLTWQTLNLTHSGRKALVTAKAAIQQHERWLESRFTDREVAKLIELLTRIHE
jgi:hypothetical protein